MEIIAFIMIGALAGLVMGTVGVGGGAVVIVSLLLVLQFPQKLAQGTTLFVVAAPVSLLAAFNYYQKGFVHLKGGLIIMASFLLFSYLGAEVAGILPQKTLKSLLGVMLMVMGGKLLFFR